MAIHAAGIPATWRTLSADDITTMANIGIERLGLAKIREIDQQWRALNKAADTAANRKAMRRLWPSARMEQSAVSLAYRLRQASARTARAAA